VADAASPNPSNTGSITVASNPPGTEDTVSGSAGAVEGSAWVIIYSDSRLTNEIGRVQANEDGSFSLISIGDNQYGQVYVIVQDAAGNKSGKVSVTADIIPPDTTLAPQSSNPTSQTSATFTFTATETGSTFECQIDAGGYAFCTSPQTYTGLSGGSHTFYIRAIDQAGNADSTPDTFTWTIDSQAPDTSITSFPPSLVNSPSVAFEFTCDKIICTFECQIDAGGYASCVSPQAYTLLDGTHTFEVRAIDAVGNIDASPASYGWAMETLAPDTSITSSPSNPTNSTSASFGFTSTETSATFKCRIDSGAYSDCTSPNAYSGLAAGTHTFAVYAIDPAGNADSTPSIYIWAIDTTLPTQSGWSPASGSTLATKSPALTLSLSENGDCKWSLSDLAYSGMTGDCTGDGTKSISCGTSGLSEGTNNVYIACRDSVGNMDTVASNTHLTYTVDTTPPTQSGWSPASASVLTTKSPTITLSLTESGDCKWSLSDQNYAAMAGYCAGKGTTSISCGISGLSEGANTVYLACQDSLANADTAASNKHLTYTVNTPADTTPPTQSGWSPASASVLTTKSPTITLSLDENGDCKWSTDDQGYSIKTGDCTGDGTMSISCDASGLLEGANTVHIACQDADGNRHTAATNTDLAYTVDTTPPTQFGHNPASSSTIDTESPTITFSLTEDGDCKWSLSDQSYSLMTTPCTNIDPDSISCDISGLSEGANTVYIACQDSLANANTAATNTALNYTVDTTPPTQSGWSPASGSAIATTSPAVTFTLNENGDCRWSLDGDESYADMSDDGDCTGEGSTSISCSVSGLAEGANTVYLACRDSLLNADTNVSNTELTYTVDTTPPTQSGWNPAYGSTITTKSPTITFNLNENGDCKWALFDLGYASMTGDCTGDGTTSISCGVSGLAGGPDNYVYIACRDPLLNADDDNLNTHIRYTVDTTPPTQSGHNPGSSTIITTESPTITFSLNEYGDCKWSLSDLAYAGMTGECTGDGTTSISCGVSGLLDGARTVYISCRDTIGNQDSIGSNTHLLYTVNAPPAQSGWSPASGSSIATKSPTITLSLNENGDCKWSTSDLAYAGMTGDCSGDGTTSISCATSSLSECANTVHIACQDSLLNADTVASNKHLAYTVDTTLPTQSGWSPASGTTIATKSPTITLSLNENGDCKWSLSDQAYADMTGDCSGDGTASISCAASGLSEGSNTVYTACRDTLLNADTAASNTALTLTADTTLPTQSAHSPASGTTLATKSPTIVLSLNENGDCKWALSDQAYGSMAGDCSGDGTTSISCATSGLSEGANTVYLACRDSVLNADTIASNTALAYTVDTTLPTQSGWSPASGSTIATKSPAVTFSLNENGDCKWSLSDQAYGSMAGDCTGDGTTSISCAASGLLEGANTVYLACRDSVLNADTIASNTGIAYTVDTTPPTQSGWSPASGSTIATKSPAITLNLNENGDCKWALSDQNYAGMAGDCTGDGTTSITCGTSGLSENANTVYVACRDSRSNADTADTNTALAYTVDTTPPTQSGWSPVSGTTTSPTINLSLDETGDCRWALSDQAYAAMAGDCSGDGTTSISCAASGLAEGPNTVYLACQDSRSNADTIATNKHLAFTVDTTRPTQSAHNPASPSTIATKSPTITLSLNENGDCKWSTSDLAYAGMAGDCTGDGTTSISCSASGLAEGPNTVYVACQDSLGNADTIATNTALAYTVDTALPTQSGHSPASGSTITTASPSITLTLNENGDCKWSLTDLAYGSMAGDCTGDGGTSISCSNSGLAEGANSVYIACRDTVGNADTVASNTALNYTVDTTPPTQSNWSPASGSAIATTSPTITLNLNENGDCKWSLSDLAYGSMAGDCTGDGTTSISCSASGLSEGANSVYIACQDTRSNADTIASNTALSYTVDTARPTQSNWSPAYGSTIATKSPTITLNLNENGDCKWSLSDQAYASMAGDCTGDGGTSISCSASGLSEGANSVYISCRDTVGNADTDATNTDLAYTADTTPPTQSGHSPASGASIATKSPTITLNLNENGDCKWSLSDQAYASMAGDCTGDGGTSISCAASGLAEGSNTVYVACRDTLLNADTIASNTALAYTVDTILPTQSGWSPASESTIATKSPVITLSLNENGDCKWSLSDQAYAGMAGDCTGDGSIAISCSTSGLDEDNNTVYLACRDTVGNADTIASNTALSYTVDTTPPTQSSHSPAPGSVIASSVTITFGLGETGDCKWSLSDQAYADMTGDCTGDGTASISCAATGLVDGTEVVYLACRDSLLNADTIASNTELTYTVSSGDITPPVQSAHNPASGSTVGSTAPPVTLTLDENGDCRWSLDGDESYDNMSDDGDCIGDGTASIVCAVSGLADGAANTVYIACEDTVPNKDTAATNTALTINVDTGGDASPPIQSNQSPATGSTLTTKSPTVTLTLDEAGDCRWSLSDLDYAAMAGDCSGDGSTSISCATSALPEGSVTVYITCRDAYGNADLAGTTMPLSYTVDTLPPTQSAWSPASPSTITTISPTVTFNLNENADCKWSHTDQAYGSMANDCTGDGTTSASCSVTGLSEGSNTVYTACRDSWGNSNSAANNKHLYYTVNTLPPTQSNWSPASGSTILNTTPNVSLTLNENGNCKWSLTDQDYASMAGDCTGDGTTSIFCSVSGLAEGANTVYIACQDTYSNADTVDSNTHLAYTVDTTPPVQSGHSPATAATASPTITFSLNENGDCKWALTDLAYADMANDCTGDGSTSISCATSGLSEGANTIYFACRDTMSTPNADTIASNTHFAFTVDTTPPVQSGWSPASGSTLTTTSPTVTFNLNESGDCRWSLDGDESYADMSDDGSCSFFFGIYFCNVSGLSQGSNTVYFACQDTLLNADTSATNTALTYNVDSVRPVQSGWSPASGSTIATKSPTITLNLNENSDCKWSLSDLAYGSMAGDCTGDGGTSISCAASGLSESTNNVYIACRDTAGNADTAATNTGLTYTVDTLPPTQSNWDPASASTITTKSPTIYLNLDENGDCKWSLTDDSYSVMLGDCTGDGSTTISCDVSGLSEGAVSVYIACQDSLLNEDTAASNTALPYTVDTTPPVQSDWNPASGSILATDSPTVSLSLNENGDCRWSLSDDSYAGMGGDCTGDGTASASCDIWGLAQGAGTVYIACRDAYLNADTAVSNTALAFTVDTVLPETYIDSSPSNPSGTSGSFSFSCNEAVCTFECQLDSAGYSSCTSPKNYSGLSGAGHTFEVRAVDQAVNTDSSPAWFGWTVDAAPPVQSSWNPRSGSTIAQSSPVITLHLNENGDCRWSLFDQKYDDMAGDCTGDGGTSITCSASGLVIGTNAVYIACRDAYANADTAASNTQLLYILDEVDPETEPNNGGGICDPVGVFNPQTIMYGEINPASDNDFYCVAVTGGHTVDFDIDANELGSLMRSVIWLYDTDGVTVLASSGFNATDPDTGWTQDSYLSYSFPVTGTYYLRVRDDWGNHGSDYWYYLFIEDITDTDHDGLSDWHETNTYLTDPNDADSDNDGYSDGFEVQYGSDPLDPLDPPLADSDSDGLTDWEETNVYGTNPADNDSDDDGLLDGEEVETYSTDPLDPDSDNDGLSDGFETGIGTDPNDSDTDGDTVSDYDELCYGGDCGTYTPGTDLNPNNPDTDGDGYNDWLEIQKSTDPLDVGSYPDMPQVLINEVFTGQYSWIELYNADTVSFDLSNWYIYVQISGWGSNDFQINSYWGDVSIDPGQRVVLDYACGTNTPTHKYSCDYFNWCGDSATGSVGLRDESSFGLDFVRWGGSTQNPPQGTSWSESDPIEYPCGTTLSLQRYPDGADTDTDTDWALMSRTSEQINSPDTDGDSLSDWAETNLYGTYPNDSDSDDDTYSDGAEVMFGSDPLDPDSVPFTFESEPNNGMGSCDPAGIFDPETIVAGTINPAGESDYYCVAVTGGHTIAFDIEANELGSPMRSYLYLYNPAGNNLTSAGFWGTDPETGWYGDSYLTYSFPVTGTYYIRVVDDWGQGGPGYWYLLRMEDITDTDGDGLTDWSETNTYGTDPNDPDTDDDTVFDGIEVQGGSDPLDPLDPPAVDSDSDGLFDFEEDIYGTNPADNDTDDDGLLDGAEVKTWFTNPLYWSSDSDNLSDGDEVSYGTDPNDWDTDGDQYSDYYEVCYDGDCGTYNPYPNPSPDMNPLSLDTDGDGYGDWLEVQKGSNPVNAGSVPDMPRILINEVFNETYSWIELYNADTISIDLTNWRIRVQAPGWSDSDLTIGNRWGSFSINPGQHVVLDFGSGTNTPTHKYWYWGFSWCHWGDGTGGAAELIDDSNFGIDFVRWGNSTAEPNQGTIWSQSAPISYPCGTTSTLHRDEASTDTNTDADWELGLASPEQTNSPDNDSDGLTDWDEINGTYGYVTDPNDWDTDGDLISDGDEILGGTDPTDSGDPLPTDTDGDGLSDAAETIYGTNPSVQDTDGDGLLDGEEVSTYLTDPLDLDSDGDGLEDGDEVFTYGTNPAAPDTDGDGYGDGMELGWVPPSDPLDEGSVPPFLLEHELNNKWGSCNPAGSFDPDATVFGHSNQNGDYDYYCVAVTGGHTIEFDIEARELGSFSYTFLTLYDTDGLTELRNGYYYESDPEGYYGDPYFTHTFVSSGTYYLRVMDYNGNSGPDYWYFLMMEDLHDTDDDGLSDGRETYTYGTDPNDWDTDGDLISDGNEVLTYLTNPLNPADPAVTDSDLDGLSDFAESNVYGTNPADLDTDGDSLYDGDEVGIYFTDPLDDDSDDDGGIDGDEVWGWFTDPNDWDMDGDGFSDFYEICYDGVCFDWYDPLADLNPFNPDTDGDGYSDWLEVQKATDPLNAGSYPTMPQVRINEVFTEGGNSWIELYNAGATLFNLTNWSIYYYYSTGWNNASISSWDNFFLNPGEHVILDFGCGTDTSNHKYNCQSFSWCNYSESGAVGLVDNSGIGIDFVRWGGSEQNPTPGTLWSESSPISYPCGTNKSLQRYPDGTDTNTATDWTLMPSTPAMPNSPDTDHDGLSDWEENQLGTNPNDSDSDNDTYSDGWEVEFWSNPMNPASTPYISETEPNNDLGFCNPAGPFDPQAVVRGVINPVNDYDYYCFTVNAGHTISFDIEATEFGSPMRSYLNLYDGNGNNLASRNTWETDPETGWYGDSYLTYSFPVTGTYYLRVYENNGYSGPAYWYYLRIEDLNDTDGDGLRDWYETNIYGTDPNDADTDNDGISDGIEVENGSNPLNPSSPPPADFDSDGLSNWEETIVYDTNLAIPDTDSDGLTDGCEVYAYSTYFTDPLNWDSDGDSLGDGDEVLVFGTNPLDSDTDGDGIGDQAEICYDGNCGSYTPGADLDPNSPDTDGDGYSDWLEVQKGTDPIAAVDFPDMPQVRINEVFTEQYSFIELYNADTVSFNLSSWIIYVQADGWGYNNHSISNWDSFTLNSGEHVALHFACGEDTPTDKYYCNTFSWCDWGYEAGSVWLVDSSGWAIDFVRWNGSMREPPAGTLWSESSPISHPCGTEASLQRYPDGADTDTDSDWVVMPPTPAKINSPDTDDDGLSDWEENNLYGTNPGNPDTDGDTYYDGLEVQFESDPLDPDVIPFTSESEPNYAWGNCDPVGIFDPEGIVYGEINPNGDADVYCVAVTGGHTVDFDIEAREWGSYLYSYLTLYDVDGTTSLYDNSPYSYDPDTDWYGDSYFSYAFPVTGTYYLRVTNYNSGGGPDFWYYLRTEDITDTDADGLSDWYETNVYGSNLNNPDSDGDGLDDGPEVHTFGTNPADADPDGDGLTDYQEVCYDSSCSAYTPGADTNPNDPDTDNDSLSDGTEVNTFSTNPVKADTDSDAYNDYQEICYDGNCSAYTPGSDTNPNNRDTDGDHFGDGYEIAQGYDPLDPLDVPPPLCNGGCSVLNVNGTDRSFDTVPRTDTSVYQTARDNCLAVGGDLTNFDESYTYAYWRGINSADYPYYSYENAVFCNSYAASGYSSCCGMVGDGYGWHDLYGCSCHYCGNSGDTFYYESAGYVCVWR
jgi:hypothetical protein